MSVQLQVKQVAELLDLHRKKSLVLQSTVGLSAQVNLDGDTRLLVTELLRLAHLGAAVEATLASHPRASVNRTAAAANIEWRCLTRVQPC